MSRTYLRAILAVLLLMTVINKTRVSASLTRETLTSNVLEVLSEHRLSPQRVMPERDLLPTAAYFQVPGCDGPIEVIPIHINLQEAPIFDALVKPAYTRQFAYLDKTWLGENRVGMRLTWLKHKLLSFLGIGHFANSTTGLLIASPPNCRAASTIDWSPVWRRRMVAVESAG
jgi:hypothetical protein